MHRIDVRSIATKANGRIDFELKEKWLVKIDSIHVHFCFVWLESIVKPQNAANIKQFVINT